MFCPFHSLNIIYKSIKRFHLPQYLSEDPCCPNVIDEAVKLENDTITSFSYRLDSMNLHSDSSLSGDCKSEIIKSALA